MEKAAAKAKELRAEFGKVAKEQQGTRTDLVTNDVIQKIEHNVRIAMTGVPPPS